jgi:hypothetical protein
MNRGPAEGSLPIDEVGTARMCEQAGTAEDEAGRIGDGVGRIWSCQFSLYASLPYK